MKRVLRISFLILLVLAAAGMLTWYLLMKREVPPHARCIPKDAVAVLTLNVRELALDRAQGGHLFPEFEKKTALPKEAEAILKAVDRTEGSGIAKTSDVLCALFRSGDAAFIGIAARVTDSTKLGTLVRDQLGKDFRIARVAEKGATVFHVDTNSLCFGYRDDVALAVFPLSDHGFEKSAEQCARLLSLPENESVLSDDNFREHELSSFDAGI